MFGLTGGQQSHEPQVLDARQLTHHTHPFFSVEGWHNVRFRMLGSWAGVAFDHPGSKDSDLIVANINTLERFDSTNCSLVYLSKPENQSSDNLQLSTPQLLLQTSTAAYLWTVPFPFICQKRKRKNTIKKKQTDRQTDRQTGRKEGRKERKQGKEQNRPEKRTAHIPRASVRKR